MKQKSILIVALLLILALSTGSVLAADVDRMTVDELSAALDSGAVVVVDVRRGSDWKGSEVKIPGAVRLDPRQIDAGAATLPKDKTLVLYCAWPNEYTSARAAQMLMGLGFEDVKALKGGWNEWQRGGFPTEYK